MGIEISPERMDLGSYRIQFSNQEKPTKDAESFYDCRICMDVATDPVVTCCGHLFCWSCLYKWLNVSTNIAKQCPICKGEVAIQNLTPINGCGGNGQKPEISTNLKVPPRPQARRVESLKEAIRKEGFTIMGELILRLEQKFDLAEVFSCATQGSSGRTNSFLSRVLTSRGMRGERNSVLSPNEAASFMMSSPTNTDTGLTPLHGLTLTASFTSASNSTEGLIGSDFTTYNTDSEMPGNDWFGFTFSANESDPNINDIDDGQMLEGTNATDSETESQIIEAFYEATSEINSEPEIEVLEAQAPNEIFYTLPFEAMETAYDHIDSGPPFQAVETALVEMNSGLPFQAVETELETVNDMDNRVSQAGPDSLTPETVNETNAGVSTSTSSRRRSHASAISNLDDGNSRLVRRRIG